ncbi:MAG: glycoside hydrolase family 78 protein [Streptococcaceae bacterium]|jgi:alpha-L-rhamnosidase|nr:glycoside hydrolase family 78 protein [Streptococcaceae bacterium]
MKISEITVNHMFEPIGFLLEDLHIEFKVESDKYVPVKKQLTVWTHEESEALYKTEFSEFDTNTFILTEADLILQPRTRYFVRVSLTSDDETISAETFFETGKMSEAYSAVWIANQDKALQNTLFKKTFEAKNKIQTARLYITGLGVYEAYLNGQKIGDEILAPGVTAYDQLIQVQSYDLSASLTEAEASNELLISTADGWYKGAFNFDNQDKIYGDQHRVIAELHLVYEDGSKEVICTDSSWLTTQGQIEKSAIYYGEDWNATYKIDDWTPVVVLQEDKSVLQDRLSLPIKIQEKLPVKEIITTPSGETVLDFGQNQAGWIEFYSREAYGTKLKFEFGEILQNGNFYRENLREARAAFVYTSDGSEKWIHPHFTYFGYRYVRVTGNTMALDPDDFQADVIYSELKQTGFIETDNTKVNRLFENVTWGQKSNFFDVPTDCPQRNERLGWTGDANVFSNTAAFNMDVYAFYVKYLKDIAIEQKRFDGMVPLYAPAMGGLDGGAAVWADAVTFIPWNVYNFYGDTAILRQNYSNMKAWVDWISRHTKTPSLWTAGFQFGDWLALDGEDPAFPTGKTDADFIASVYYYNSSKIVAESAALLGFAEDAERYAKLADDILKMISQEYITETGRLVIDSQTAYSLALYFEVFPEDRTQRILSDLVARLHKDNDHLKTGFVGTPLVCQALSKYGRHKLAMKIFLQEDFPSWLYAVNMGATTVWERWDSVEPDGSMNKFGMNSLNHYSIGAVMEWAYKYILGIGAHQPGYKEFTFAPHFDFQLKKVSGKFMTAYGAFTADYQIEAEAPHKIAINCSVPFGVTVNVALPYIEAQAEILVNGVSTPVKAVQLKAGHHQISYVPTEELIEHYDSFTSLATIMADELLVAEIDKIDGVLNAFKNPDALNGDLGNIGTLPLRTLSTLLPFINVEEDKLDAIERLLEGTAILTER